MSRFANPDRTTVIELDCGCPPKADGTPRHEKDTFTVRVSLSHNEMLRVTEGTVAQASLSLLATTIKDWNLVDDAGKAVPCDAESIAQLDTETGNALVDKIGDAINEARRLPNSSAGNLPASSRAKK